DRGALLALGRSRLTPMTIGIVRVACHAARRQSISIRLGLVIVAAARMVPLGALGQPAESPVVVPLDPGMQRALQAQPSAFLASQQCVAENDGQYRLFSATEPLIRARDNRKAVEYELATNPARREQFKGGYDEVMATALAHYRAAGGTASAVADVVPV